MAASAPPARRLQLLIVSKGHPYDVVAFRALTDTLPNVESTHVEQPAAQAVLEADSAARYDAVLFYDMSGIGMPGGDPGVEMGDPIDPPLAYQRCIEALLERGTGIVLLNHGLVSWPSWPLWREISGTSYLLRDAEIEGEALPASGYRGGMGQPDRNATFTVRPACLDHPVLAGLAAGFEISDELYLKTPGFEQHVVPLLRSDFSFEAEHFSPPPLAPPEVQATWSHPRGSDLVVWANAARNSPVVASELGDGPSAYANPGFRRLLANAVHWVASQEARSWAKETND
jgi:hypothetical protein